MAYPSVTYTFTNGTTGDATKLNRDFADLVNGVSDGTKDIRVATAKIGSTANYTEIESDGTVRFVGNATVWRDENFSASVTSIGANAPALISWSTTSILVPSFPHNNTKELNLLKEYDHSGKIGSTIVFHAHIFPTTADPSGTVKLSIEYMIKNDGQAAVTGTSSATYDVTGCVQWDEYRVDIASIQSAALSQGCQIGARLYRLSTDPGTYAHPIAITTWGYHYEIDTIGSRTITTK